MFLFSNSFKGQSSYIPFGSTRRTMKGNSFALNSRSAISMAERPFSYLS